MLIDEIKKANIEAMKKRDNVTRGVISVVMTRYKLQEVELKAKGKEIGDAELLAIIQKVIKELAEEKAGYIENGNAERAKDIEIQEQVLNSYLPKQLSEQDIKDEIAKLEDKSIPSIMKHFKTNFAGKVDLSLVSKIAKGL